MATVTCLAATASGQPVDFAARMALDCEALEHGGGTASFACRTDDGAFDGVIAVTSPGPIALPAQGGLPDVSEGVWVFDHRHDGSLELVLHLYVDSDGARADIFDRRTLLAALRPSCCDADDLNGLWPTVTVRAPEGWWLPSGRPHPLLDIDVDGNVYVIFGGSTKLDAHLRTDGVIDYQIHVRVAEDDGRPAYEYRRALVPRETSQEVFRRGQAIERTAVTMNEGADEPDIVPWIPWPYLGPVTYGFLTNSALADSYPPIQIDFETGLITTVGEFVRSRGNDSQWFIYSFDDLTREGLNVLGFETPFAFYDLFKSDVPLPELALRMTHIQPSSSLFFRGGWPHPITGVRYSWIQQQDSAWRTYKVGLLGEQEHGDEIEIDGYRIATFAPYDALPTWVLDETWRAATFVAEMRPRSATGNLGEGLHVWDVDTLSNGRFLTYAVGATTNRRAAVAGTVDIPEGLRGEYALDKDLSLRLYASTIDGELHLVGAAGGTWNQGNGRYITYGNLDGGRYIDVWTMSTRSGDAGDTEGAYLIEEQMYFLPGHLVFADSDGLRIKEVPGLVASRFETVPPTDPATWASLQASLSEGIHTAPPRTVASMFDDQDGAFTSVPLARLLAATYASGRYAFVVAMPGDDLWPAGVVYETVAGRQLLPGPNVLSFEPGGRGWTAEPLRVGPFEASLDVDAAQRLSVTALTLTINNYGNFRRDGAAELRIGGDVVHRWTSLEVEPSGGRSETREIVYWSPSRVGTLDAELELGSVVIGIGTVDVTAAPSPPRRTDLVLGTVVNAGPFLITFGLAAVLVFMSVGRSLRTPRT